VCVLCALVFVAGDLVFRICGTLLEPVPFYHRSSTW
jgi:hypothetical protein